MGTLRKRTEVPDGQETLGEGSFVNFLQALLTHFGSLMRSRGRCVAEAGAIRPVPLIFGGAMRFVTPKQPYSVEHRRIYGPLPASYAHLGSTPLPERH